MQVKRNWAYVLSFLLIFDYGLQAPRALQADSTATAHASADTAAIELPLDYVDQHLYTRLDGTGSGPLTFLVDTGSEHTGISSAIAKQMELPKSFWKKAISVNGYGNNSKDREYGEVPLFLRSAQSKVFSGSARVLDFEDFGKQLGHPLDGILGWDFFQLWCSTLDVARKQLTLRPVSDCAMRADAHVVKSKWSKQGLRLRSVISFQNGKSANALVHFDTGADATLQLNTQFRAMAGLGERGPADSEAKRWGVNGEYIADIVPVGSIKFDGDEFQVVIGGKTTILFVRKGSVSRPRWWIHGFGEARINRDGAVGNAIIEHLVWTLDPATRQIYATTAATD